MFYLVIEACEGLHGFNCCILSVYNLICSIESWGISGYDWKKFPSPVWKIGRKGKIGWWDNTCTVGYFSIRVCKMPEHIQKYTSCIVFLYKWSCCEVSNSTYVIDVSSNRMCEYLVFRYYLFVSQYINLHWNDHISCIWYSKYTIILKRESS